MSVDLDNPVNSYGTICLYRIRHRIDIGQHFVRHFIIHDHAFGSRCAYSKEPLRRHAQTLYAGGGD